MQKKIVNIFGCSQTAGVAEYKITNENGNDFYGSWAYWLSVWNPDVIFYNYSWPGTSLIYSCHCFDKFKDRADKNIIQMTGPHRLTYYTPVLDPFEIPLEQITPNYYMLTNQDWFDEHFVRVTNASESDNSFIKNYYEFKPHEHSLLEHLALSEYFGKRADFAFSHAKMFKYRYDDLNEIVPNVLRHMTDEQYESYKCDEPGHFNEAGHIWMADWVAKHSNLVSLK